MDEIGTHQTFLSQKKHSSPFWLSVSGAIVGAAAAAVLFGEFRDVVIFGGVAGWYMGHYYPHMMMHRSFDERAWMTLATGSLGYLFAPRDQRVYWFLVGLIGGYVLFERMADDPPRDTDPILRTP